MAIDKISTGVIADAAVTTIKIADSTSAADGVTTAKLATDAVTTIKINNDAVTAGKIVAGAVTADITAYTPTIDTATQAGSGWTAPQLSDTTWTVTTGFTVNQCLVFLNGVLLLPTTDYTIAGTTLTLTGSVPPVGSSLIVRYLAATG